MAGWLVMLIEFVYLVISREMWARISLYSIVTVLVGGDFTKEIADFDEIISSISLNSLIYSRRIVK